MSLLRIRLAAGALTFALVARGAAAAEAQAVCGDRIFPANPAIDDPGISDERTLRTVQGLPQNSDGVGHFGASGLDHIFPDSIGKPIFPQKLPNVHRSPTMSIAIRAIAAFLALAGATTAAFAHAQLEKAAPPVGGTVAAPSEIRLEFSEGVEPRFCVVALAAPGGANVPLEQPKAEGSDRRVLIVPITNLLAPGAYTVHWRAVSVDTHHTQGTFQFNVKP